MRLKGTDQGEAPTGREYAYFGLTPTGNASLEPVPKMPALKTTEQQLHQKIMIRNLEEQLHAEKDRCQQLETQLAASTFHQLETVQTVFPQELDALYLAAGPVAAGPGNMEQLTDFSFQQLQQQFSKYAPQLTETIQSLGRHSGTLRSNILDIHS